MSQATANEAITDDPLLRGRGISGEGYENEFSSFTSEQLNIVTAYLCLIWNIKSEKAKNIPISQIINTTQRFFVDAQLRSKDSLWRQHVASSLRELLDDLRIPEDFLCALACLPPEFDAEGSQASEYAILRDFKSFFNGYVHFQPGMVLDRAKSITGDQQLTKIDDDLFEHICSLYIKILLGLFARYCMKHGENYV